MDQNNTGQIRNLLGDISRRELSAEALHWLEEKVQDGSAFNAAFAAIPRRTGKKVIELTREQMEILRKVRPGSNISGWTIDRLARVWLLLNLDSQNKDHYVHTLEALFLAAEVNELVALYSALPFLDYPESWPARCAEGIRSNIADVLLAIMCNNPYPSENLSEAAWNQMVLKAFFTEKPIHLIVGLDIRANERLARTLSDYAHERWAAHRAVNPQLWRCVGKFTDKNLFSDIERLWASGEPLEKEAVALACHDSHYGPAKQLLSKNKNLESAISSGQLTWNRLAEKITDYVLQP